MFNTAKFSLNDLETDLDKTAPEIAKAFKKDGLIEISGVDEDLVQRIREAAARFFASDLKTRYSLEYVKRELEFEYLELWGYVSAPESEKALASEALYLTKLNKPWPTKDDFPELEQLTMEGINMFRRFGRAVRQALDIVYSLEDNRYLEKIFGTIAIRSYAPFPENETRQRFSRHFDNISPYITNNEIAGLQIIKRDGDPVLVNSNKGSLLVLAGGNLEDETQGEIVRLEHEIVGPIDRRHLGKGRITVGYLHP